ncbi:hypothetical protein PVAND_001894 [Polypedilum vanderplanki]|uniref:Uncharacterized protein n=1 Tax=Polypedilum vanderplanki TaxID=319348 RepID=A0A9J6BPM6_POLVA|nr:hypothetical protein PVAND_001894 [Polypedilum vanderplanki]
MKNFKFLLLLNFLNYFVVDCVKILAIFTIPSKSHSILGYELFKELVASGHEVVVISPEGNELKNPPANYTNIVIGNEIIEEYEKNIHNMFNEVDVNPLFKFYDMLKKTTLATEFIIRNEKTQELLKSDIKFDLVISELALNEAVLGFSEYYNCPHVLITTVALSSWIEKITTNPSPYSYVPHIFLDLTDRMSFFGRLQNTFFHIFEDVFMKLFHYNKHQKIYETAFPNSKNFRPFKEKLRNGVSLILLNSHYSISFPRPYFPNIIEVAGMHIKKNTDHLPNDIEKFLNESGSVIYFSLGGNLKPSIMPKEKQEAIIKSLTKVNARILWKWDDENVKVNQNKFLVRKWFPQDDLLAHSKIKLFITHGGLLSGVEAIYYGKPLIVIPIFGDQKLNAARTELSGFGLRIDYNNLTEASLTWALNEILMNSKYNLRVKELSKRFKDRPEYPVDTAKFYIEYVLRHKGVFPYPSKSHSILGQELFKELAQRGHQVTFLSPYPFKTKFHENYKDIAIKSKELFDAFNEELEGSFEATKLNFFSMLKYWIENIARMQEFTLSDPAVQELLKSDEKFDLCVIEFLMNESLLGFGGHFGCKIIAVSTLGQVKYINDMVHSPMPLSTVCHPFLSFTDRMKFSQRFENVFTTLFEDTMFYFYHYPLQSAIYDKYFKKDKPSFNHMLKHSVSLVFLNTHYSLNYPQAYLPNMIEIGGFHVKNTTNPLPKDIEDFIESAKEGVIYFSLGGNLRPSKMSAEKKQTIISAFSKLKQKVIWKWDEELNVDKNKFMVRKWFPQDDILSHKNVKLFVTHGGLLSATEAIIREKPILGIPIFGDQMMNMARAELLGWGVQVTYPNLTETSLTWALKEALTNKKYKENVIKIAARLRDQQNSPMDKAIYWTEYVLRHEGAYFMQTSASSLSFIEYNNLDVYALFAFIIFTAFFLPILIIKQSFSRKSGKSSQQNSINNDQSHNQNISQELKHAIANFIYKYGVSFHCIELDCFKKIFAVIDPDLIDAIPN